MFENVLKPGNMVCYLLIEVFVMGFVIFFIPVDYGPLLMPAKKRRDKGKEPT